MADNETPKKRKTATTKPKTESKTAKTAKPKTESKIKSPEELQAKVKKSLPAEQSVLIMACLQPDVAAKATEAAKENGVEVVILEDRVIHDYLSVRDKENKEKRSLEDFLNDTSNRLHAEDQAVKLWEILTGGDAIENASKRIFTRTEVVRKTNLSHSNADKIFQLLRAFGLLQFTKGTYEFTLNFNKGKRCETIRTEVLSMCEVMSNDILRYRAAIETNEDLTDERKKELLNDLKSKLTEKLNFC